MPFQLGNSSKVDHSRVAYRRKPLTGVAGFPAVGVMTKTSPFERQDDWFLPRKVVD